MIKIEVDDKGVLDALNRLLRASDDLSPAMRSISRVLADAAERSFQGERNPATGTPWPALKPSTTQRREKNGHWPGKMLQVSGILAGSIQSGYGRDYAVAGTNVPYAATHQFGAARGDFGVFSIVRTRQQVPIPWGDIPPRPFLGISDEDRDDILDILNDYLAGALR